MLVCIYLFDIKAIQSVYVTDNYNARAGHSAVVTNYIKVEKLKFNGPYFLEEQDLNWSWTKLKKKNTSKLLFLSKQQTVYHIQMDIQ